MAVNDIHYFLYDFEMAVMLSVIIFQVCLFYTSVEGHGHLKIPKLGGSYNNYSLAV